MSIGKFEGGIGAPSGWEGLHTIPDKFAAIVEAPKPTNIGPFKTTIYKKLICSTTTYSLIKLLGKGNSLGME